MMEITDYLKKNISLHHTSFAIIGGDLNARNLTNKDENRKNLV